MFWPQRCWWTDRVHPLVIGFLIESPSPTCTDCYHKSLNRVLCGWFEPSTEWQQRLRCALLAYAPAKKKKRMDIRDAVFYDLELSSVTADRNWVYGIWPLNKTITRNRRRILELDDLFSLFTVQLSIKFSNQTFKEIHLKELTFFSQSYPIVARPNFCKYIRKETYISDHLEFSIMCSSLSVWVVLYRPLENRLQPPLCFFCFYYCTVVVFSWGSNKEVDSSVRHNNNNHHTWQLLLKANDQLSDSDQFKQSI